MRKNGVDKTLTPIEGGVCAPEGFLANGVCCGVSKAYFPHLGENPPDFALVTGVKHKRYPVACVFADGAFSSVNTQLTKRHIRYEYAQGVLVTSGVANTFGEVARTNALRLCRAVERASGLAKDELVLCSTGVMGTAFPVAEFEKMATVLCDGLGESALHSTLAARAIMTTDKYPQELSFSFYIGDIPCKIGAIFKGSTQANPNLSTTICILTTNVNITAKMLQKALVSAVNDTLNMSAIDGCSSPNDTAVILSSCTAGNYKISQDDSEYKKFYYALQQTLTAVCERLVRSGSIAAKLCLTRVVAAKSKKTARAIAKELSTILTARKVSLSAGVCVQDLLGGLQNGQEPLAVDKLQIKLQSANGAFVLFEEGTTIPQTQEIVQGILDADTVEIEIRLNEGNYSATAYGCFD